MTGGDAASAGGVVARPAAVRLLGITKRYGDLVANEAITLDVAPGEVLGLLGENGAGKSTLMKVLYGLTSPDAGTIEVGGRTVTMSSPSQAMRHGIGMVTQHFSLVLPMTIAENVSLGTVRGFVRRAQIDQRVAAAGERVGLHVDPARRVSDLSVGERQRVEILKALYRDCSVLILDEPTAVLTPQEVGALFATIRGLTAHGLAVVIISHKLHEIREICDRVSVLHRGRLVGTSRLADVDDELLVKMMIGGQPVGAPIDPATVEATGAVVGHGSPRVRTINTAAGNPNRALSIAALVVDGPGDRPLLDRVSIAVERGEIVGVAGVSGNGQRELVEVLSGMRRSASGSVIVGGVNVTNGSPIEMVASGLGRLAEDRHHVVVPDLSVAHNLVLERIDDFRRGRRLDEARILAHAQRLIDEYAIRATPTTRMGTLSGGNIQKVLLARVLDPKPVALVVAQPTRGLDIGATAYVHTQLRAARDRGAGVVMVSEDIDELLDVADRIVVMNGGRVVGEVPAAGATPEMVGALMTRDEAA